MSLAYDPELVPQWTLGDRLAKTLREAKGGEISVQAMADELGRARNTVTNYIHGHTTPPRSVLIVWAMRTGWPLWWIEDPDSPPAPDDDPGIRLGSSSACTRFAQVIPLTRPATAKAA